MTSTYVHHEAVSGDCEVPVWTYVPTAESDESLRRAALVISYNQNVLRLKEDFQMFQIVCLSVDTDGETIEEEDMISFDFNKQIVYLSSKKITIVSSSINFIHPISSLTSMDELLLSYQKKDTFKVLHFKTSEDKLQFLFILNAFRRLMFEFEYYKSCFKSAEEAVTIINNRSPLFVGELHFSITACSKIKNPSEEPFRYNKHTVLLEVSCMYLFQYTYSCEPLYTLYFGDTLERLVVENVCWYRDTNTVTLDTKENSFNIRGTKCQAFLKAIGEIYPKHISEDLSGSPRFILYANLQVILFNETGIHIGIVCVDLIKLRKENNLSHPSESIGSPPLVGASIAEKNKQIRTFQEDMNNAVATFEHNEQLQLPWIVAETELNDLLSAGFIPETEFTDFNPNSIQHFYKCVREIEHHLTRQKFALALSVLQVTRLIFSESSLSEMIYLFMDDDVTLMKKIYFHSFL